MVGPGPGLLLSDGLASEPLRLPDPCLVILVGASASGKTHWASEWFAPDQIVSSDRLRAVVGAGERDQRASRDAFEVLSLIVEKRMRRRLTTVIDSTGLEASRRAGWLGLAERHGVPAYALVFDPPDDVEASASYRRRVAPVLARRALERAAARARANGGG